MRALVEINKNEQHIIHVQKVKFHKIDDTKVKITLVTEGYGMLEIQVPDSAAQLYKSQLLERRFANFSGMDVNTMNYIG